MRRCADYRHSRTLTDSLKTEFQPVDEPSEPARVKIVDEAMLAYEYAPACKPTLNNSSEVIQATKRPKCCKPSGPNSVTYRLLGHVPKRAITFLTQVFNAVPSSGTEARSNGIHTEARKGLHSAFSLQTRKFTCHC